MEIVMRGSASAKAEVHAVIAKHIATGDITGIEVDGKLMTIDSLSTPAGTMKAGAHPKDDKHSAHPHGHSQTSYKYKLK